jgi:ectoine hydroxylase-related dioxygenase (phytanoyl-CoA dioxygenase family)
MKPETAIQAREQMTRDGYCVIDDILTRDFLHQLREETERLIEAHEPPPDIRYQGQHVNVRGTDNAIIKKLLDWRPTREALVQLGFGDFESSGGVIVLTKDPGEPALYWHQDWMRWNDPISCSPWPQTMFVSYYLSDTTIENGCLKVIPGTHLKRIPLHNQLVPAHEQGARFVEEDHPIMFSNHPGQVDVCVAAGSLVLADARILHSARRNLTSHRRTLILAWHSRPTITAPAYWDGDIPNVVLKRATDQDYPGSRIPGNFLQ